MRDEGRPGRRITSWVMAGGLAVATALAGCRGVAPARAAAPVASPPAAAAPAPAGDVALLKGGAFRMGAADGTAFERPVHIVELKPFWMDRTPVTVAQFAAFVKATGYRTTAEKLGWSGVFDLKTGDWTTAKGASWRHPDGPAAPPPDPNEPVTQVSYDDAAAYARWAHKRLPTEAEFEYAARGGLAGKRYAWGDDLRPGGRPVANWWQGSFPDRNTGEDGYVGRSPVGHFPANGFGLYDMTGDVWEWCADWFGEDYYAHSPRRDPKGPATGSTRVLRGGSWLCSENYCRGFRVAARSQTPPDSGLNNTGFRCARDAGPQEARR